MRIGAVGASAVAFTVSGIESDDSGTLTFSDGSHSVAVTITDGLVVTGTDNTLTTVNLSSLADDTSITSSLALTDTAGNSFTASGNAVTLDQDTTEQPSVAVDNGSTTPIGAAGASAVAFTGSGIESDYSGTLTYSDGSHSVAVTITDGLVVTGTDNTLTTVNLSSLADDTSITSSLALTDTAGNSFTASGNAVTLDQDTTEQPSVAVDNGSTTPIGAAGASAVAFTVSGIESDDSGTLTFSDGSHSVAVTITDGAVVTGTDNTLTTVNLSSLADDTSITSSLALTDTAGNSCTASGNAVTLAAAGPTLTIADHNLTV